MSESRTGLPARASFAECKKLLERTSVTIAGWTSNRLDVKFGTTTLCPTVGSTLLKPKAFPV